jgi:hypothetical protein
LLIDCDEDRTLRAVLVGMLREIAEVDSGALLVSPERISYWFEPVRRRADRSDRRG